MFPELKEIITVTMNQSDVKTKIQELADRLPDDKKVLADADLPTGIDNVAVGTIDENTDWLQSVETREVVVHLAARVHVMLEDAEDSLERFRKVNVQGSLNLARQAAAAGVKRFLFLSSIKVNGESTELGRAFSADDQPMPEDAYGISKMEAERGLIQISKDSGMEVVIIRPPLIYGPGVKANFLSMLRWLKRGVPLPVGAIYNQRSLVALDNLVDLMLLCLEHPLARNEIFLVSDNHDVSITELLNLMGRALGKPPRLISIPSNWLKLAASLTGKRDFAQRLCGSLQVDIGKTRCVLGWTPPLSIEEGLRRVVNNLV